MLAAYFVFNTNDAEAARFMESDGGHIFANNPGNHRMKPRIGSSANQISQKESTDSLASKLLGDIDRVLDGRRVGRPGAVRPERSETRDDLSTSTT